MSKVSVDRVQLETLLEQNNKHQKDLVQICEANNELFEYFAPILSELSKSKTGKKISFLNPMMLTKIMGLIRGSEKSIEHAFAKITPELLTKIKSYANGS